MRSQTKFGIEKIITKKMTKCYLNGRAIIIHSMWINAKDVA